MSRTGLRGSSRMSLSRCRSRSRQVPVRTTGFSCRTSTAWMAHSLQDGGERRQRHETGARAVFASPRCR
eukprot:25848-Eustigmatos_ZCMA.PRE.1